MLPDDDGVLVQVGDIGSANSLGVLLEHHPAEMRVQETLPDRVGVLVGIGVSVVAAVTRAPPPRAALDSTGTSGGKEDLKRECCLVRTVGPEPVVTYTLPCYYSDSFD